MTALVEIIDLTYTYLAGTPLESPALHGASLRVAEGEIVGLIGPAGAGKSTLLQHCNGLLRPSQPGVVQVAGQDLSRLDVDLRRLRQTVGLVFQHPERQVFERLVGDDIAFGPKRLGLPRPEVRQRVQWAMAVVGLDFDTFVDRPTAALSGGERRKVALAGVLALRPRLLALDEATTGLDPQAREELLGQLRRLNAEEGLTLLFVSSEMEEVAQMAERVAVLFDGRIVLEGPAADVFAQGQALQAWGMGQPATSAVLAGLVERGHAVDRQALSFAHCLEELCKISVP